MDTNVTTYIKSLLEDGTSSSSAFNSTQAAEIASTKRTLALDNPPRKRLRKEAKLPHGVRSVPAEQIGGKFRYSTALNLNNLWKAYMDDVMQVDAVKGVSITSAITSKLLKADFHGAIIEVQRSRCSSLVGVQGIVLLETRNTFKVVTKENLVKIIPKDGCVFCIVHAGHRIIVHGSHFCYSAAARSTRKFKVQQTSLQ